MSSTDVKIEIPTPKTSQTSNAGIEKCLSMIVILLAGVLIVYIVNNNNDNDIYVPTNFMNAHTTKDGTTCTYDVPELDMTLDHIPYGNVCPVQICLQFGSPFELQMKNYSVVETSCSLAPAVADRNLLIGSIFLCVIVILFCWICIYYNCK